MAPTHRIRRFLTPSLLALSLAIGTVSGAVGRDAVAPPTDPAAAARPAARSVAEALAGVPAPTGAVLAADSQLVDGTGLAAGVNAVPATETTVLTGAPGERPNPRLPALRPAAVPTVTAGGDTASDSPYRGRNHVWMPSLRIDRSVARYACSNKSYPGNRVYRWGCAGRNNVYLFGHAHSVFKPLHDAYVRGRLRKGAKLYYADSSGRVRTYRVAWWKVTTPTKGTWAYAAQSKPSLTLQTCVGSRNQYRLIVRLTQVS